MSGPAVTVVTSGGIPVVSVTEQAPEFQVVDSGGVAVTVVASGGVPMILTGYTPPP